MITLNTDKGIVRISTFEELQGRPGFQARVDPRAVRLKAILGAYQFKDEINCGLPCNQLHMRGYLVVTDDGIETNIGKDCGAKYFSVDWEEMTRTFDRDLLRAERRETLRLFQARLPAYRARLDEIKESGANDVHRLSRPLVEPIKGLPRRILSAVDGMIRTGSGDVSVDREAGAAEHAGLEAQAGRKLPKPQYVSERVGVVQGLGFFAPELDLRRLIPEDIEKMLPVIAGLDDATATDRQLGDAAKWAGEADTKLGIIARAVVLGRQLLTRANLSPLSRLLSDKDERAAFTAYLAGLPPN